MTAARRDALRRVLASDHPQVDRMLVTGPANVRYLSGFTGSHGALLIDARGDDDWLGTDGRYTTQCAAECPDLPVVVDRSAASALVAAATARRPFMLGLEADHVSMAQGATLSALVDDRLHLTSGVVEWLRSRKDAAEIADIRLACELSVAALEAVLPRIAPGVCELQVARWLEQAMGDLGAEGPAFPSIIASGPNSAIPHHQPGSREIQSGDLLKMDFGARVHGYHADMTRTFVVGAQAADWQREIHDVVRRSQEAGAAALVPGVQTREVDVASRGVVDAAGYGPAFVHGLGHGVGLEIHEVPFMGQTSTGSIAPATTITVEPGIYLPDRGGVRIEDTFLVGLDETVPLTRFPRDLLVLA